MIARKQKIDSEMTKQIISPRNIEVWIIMSDFRNGHTKYFKLQTEIKIGACVTRI